MIVAVISLQKFPQMVRSISKVSKDSTLMNIKRIGFELCHINNVTHNDISNCVEAMNIMFKVHTFPLGVVDNYNIC